MTAGAMQRLYEGADWDFSTLRRLHDACAEIAAGELGLDTYPSQIEVITAEQMLDAYASGGMPLFYKHWSFGKHFTQHEALYRRGLQGLAYEIVINSSPCIAYLEVGEASHAANPAASSSSLWRSYEKLLGDGLPLSMRKVATRGEIFTVFRDLFQRRHGAERVSA